MRIREITEYDLKLLQEIGKQTFVETFSESNGVENMLKYLETEFSTQKLKAELSNKDSKFYFAELNGKNIGYLKINFNLAQTEIKDKNALEIERIYVLNAFHGKGVGKELFNKAIENAKNNNLHSIWLGVWEHNSKAITFYKKNGFTIFDKHIFKLGEDEQTDFLMKKKITNKT